MIFDFTEGGIGGNKYRNSVPSAVFEADLSIFQSKNCLTGRIFDSGTNDKIARSSDMSAVSIAGRSAGDADRLDSPRNTRMARRYSQHVNPRTQIWRTSDTRPDPRSNGVSATPVGNPIFAAR